MNQLTDIQRIRIRAAEIVGKGWCQSSWHSGGKRCIMAAISEANAGFGHYKEVSEQLKMELDLGGIGNIRLIRWNNTKGRTQQEVIAALLPKDIAIVVAIPNKNASEFHRE